MVQEHAQILVLRGFPHVQPRADSLLEVHTCQIRVSCGRTFQASDSSSVKWALDDNQSPLKHRDVEIPERFFLSSSKTGFSN